MLTRIAQNQLSADLQMNVRKMENDEILVHIDQHLDLLAFVLRSESDAGMLANASTKTVRLKEFKTAIENGTRY